LGRVSTTTNRIRLRVALHADMRKYLAPGEKGPREVALAPGATVAELLAELGVPETEIVTVGVNGVLAGREAVLADGDDVTMFSPMEGG
jgi:sulfur carrier protein ThiS